MLESSRCPVVTGGDDSLIFDNDGADASSEAGGALGHELGD
jgi:hypothetical protein